MFSILTLFILLFFMVLILKITNTLISPSGILCSTWLLFIGFMLIFSPEILFSGKTTFYIISYILLFILGEYTHLIAFKKRNYLYSKYSMDRLNELKNDSDFKKKLGFVIIVLGILSFFGTFTYVSYIAEHFGSYKGIFTAGWAVRGAINEGFIQVPRLVTGISMVGYSTVILAMAYWILYGFKLHITLPFISMFLFGLAQAGRAGVIIIIVQLFFAFFWKDYIENKKFPEMNLIKRAFISLAVIITIFFLGIMLREQKILISLSDLNYQKEYFEVYAFGGIGAFTSYLGMDSIGKSLGWGNYSFASLYDLLGIQDKVMGVYTDYLVINNDGSAHSNIYTILRPLLDDFGIMGIILFGYFTGFIISIGYQRAIRGSIAAICFICVTYSYLVHSPLLPLTVHNSFLLSIFFPPILIYILKKIRLTSYS